jgi:membrane protein YqaA with SNARE-associated domain
MELVLNSFLSSLFFSPVSGYIFPVMVSLEGYPLLMVVVFATIGGMFGSLINFVLGYGLVQVTSRSISQSALESYEKAAEFFNKYLIYLVLLSPFAFFEAFAFAAGVFRGSVAKMLVLATTGKLFWFAYLGWYFNR